MKKSVLFLATLTTILLASASARADFSIDVSVDVKDINEKDSALRVECLVCTTENCDPTSVIAKGERVAGGA